jgi:hypothetical protein
VPFNAKAVFQFRRVGRCTAMLGVLCFRCFLLEAQVSLASDTSRYTLPAQQSGKLICPGEFPTDLTVTNCEFSERLRLQQWVTTSVTDQAMLGAILYGAAAQVIKSPGEWGRTWRAYGDRVGVRYTQAAARGTAEFIVGSFLHDDPRHLSYKEDPHTPYGTKVIRCKPDYITIKTYPIPTHLVWRRIGHAFVDSVTVLHSNTCGIGGREPAVARIVGIAAGAYGGYAWYPAAENRISNAGERAAMSYGSTLLGSFYTEFSPEISLVIGRAIARKKSK